MAIVNSNIDDVIAYLQKMKDRGYKTVEIIDHDRANGWHNEKETITFCFNESEPTVLGIYMVDYIKKDNEIRDS